MGVSKLVFVFLTRRRNCQYEFSRKFNQSSLLERFSGGPVAQATTDTFLGVGGGGGVAGGFAMYVCI